MVTANDTDGDIVKGLECGADDYITKPFSLAVLRARVNTQLKGVRSSVKKDTEVYTKDKFEFDFPKMIFKVEGEAIELSKTEQKLLFIVPQRQGEHAVDMVGHLCAPCFVRGEKYALFPLPASRIRADSELGAQRLPVSYMTAVFF